MWTILAQQTEGQHVHEAPQRLHKGRFYLQQLDDAAAKNNLQPHTYNPLEPCIARIVPTSGSPMVPINKKEDERSSLI